MSADLQVDLSSPVPPYEQIRSAIAVLVERGVLAPGARLPSVRSLAADLGVAAGTVARAYRELEGAGFVEGNGRRGTTVRAVVPGGTPSSAGERCAAVTGGTDSLHPADSAPDDVAAAVALAVARARARGMSADELAALVRRTYAAAPTPRGLVP